MKCDELKTVCYIDAYSTMSVYCAKEVDEAIDELKDNKQNLEDRVAYFQKKASDFHLMSDIRRVRIKELARALWLARAMRAKDRACKILRDAGIMFAIGECRGWDKLNTLQKKWKRVADKCRKKSEEYK